MSCQSVENERSTMLLIIATPCLFRRSHALKFIFDSAGATLLTVSTTSAYTIMSNMDTGVDPCDDFYEFACGSFLKNTIIPDEKTSVSQFTVVSDALKNKMRKLVEADLAEDEPAVNVLVKNLYQSCVQKGECRACTGDRTQMKQRCRV